MNPFHWITIQSTLLETLFQSNSCNSLFHLQKSRAMMSTIFRIAPVLMFALLAAVYGNAADENEPDKELVFDSSVSAAEGTWEFTDKSAWKVRSDPEYGQILVLSGASRYEPEVRSPLNIAWLKDLRLSDFVLEVEAMSTSREYGHRDLCFFFGKQSGTEFYYAHIATAADPHANSIFLVDNKDRVSIAEKRTAGTRWVNGKFHKIRIERQSGSGKILVYFDDMNTPIMEATDTSFSSGTIGLGSFDDVGEFRNLKIWKIEKRGTS